MIPPALTAQPPPSPPSAVSHKTRSLVVNALSFSIAPLWPMTLHLDTVPHPPIAQAERRAAQLPLLQKTTDAVSAFLAVLEGTADLAVDPAADPASDSAADPLHLDMASGELNVAYSRSM